MKDETKNCDDRKDMNKSSNRKPKRKSFKKSRAPRDDKRSDSRDVTTGEPFREFKTTQKGGNDASWYAKNPQLLADSASFSFNTALGSPVNWDFDIINTAGTGLTVNKNYSSLAYSLPGVLAIHYANYVGISRDRSSAINIASENIYSFIRHTNSGHANYDQSDLMMYFVAMDSLYSFIAYCRRVYGTARLYNQKNYYYMKALTRLQGIDYDDLIKNLSDFRAFINTISAKASAFAVPATMPIVQRHFFMASNLYKDRDSEKSQLYIYIPEGFHIYDETPSVLAPYNTAGGCVFKPLSVWNVSTPVTMSVANLISYGNSLLDAVLQSEDIGIMSGDVLKAFGGNIFKIPATPEDYVVMPVYDPEVLSQIQNANRMPSLAYEYIKNNYASEWHALDVLQDPNTSTIVSDFTTATGTIISNNTQIQKCIPSTGDRIFTLNVDHPTPADVMVASRLMQAWKIDLNGYDGTLSGPKFILSCDTTGTELVLRYQVCELLSQGRVGISNFLTEPFVNGSATLAWNSVRDIVLMSNFHNHPTTFVGEYNTANNILTVAPYGMLGDIDTYRVMSSKDLEKMNQTALLSLYGVPALGTY